LKVRLMLGIVLHGTVKKPGPTVLVASLDPAIAA